MVEVVTHELISATSRAAAIAHQADNADVAEKLLALTLRLAESITPLRSVGSSEDTANGSAAIASGDDPVARFRKFVDDFATMAESRDGVFHRERGLELRRIGAQFEKQLLRILD